MICDVISPSATILSADLALNIDIFTWDEDFVKPLQGPVKVLSIPTLNGDLATGHGLFAASSTLLVRYP